MIRKRRCGDDVCVLGQKPVCWNRLPSELVPTTDLHPHQRRYNVHKKIRPSFVTKICCQACVAVVGWQLLTNETPDPAFANATQQCFHLQVMFL
jgi:hypothetical protein